jgi:hypothetical protein
VFPPPLTAIRSLAFGIFICAVNAQAQPQVTVTDNGFSFSPDPVYIVAGEVVYWQDDGTGPYYIESTTGSWPAFFDPGGVYFTQPGTYNYQDDVADYGTIYVTADVPPTVSITYPTNSTVLAAPATFDFSADATDNDGVGMSDVEFYVGPNLVDDVFASPYTTTVSNLVAGTYVLSVIAYDNVYATATNQVTITVVNPLPILLKSFRMTGGIFRFDVSGLTIGKTNIVEATTNLSSATGWVLLTTNVATAGTMSFTNPATIRQRLFRLVQLP